MQDGRNHRNEYLHNITNEREKDNKITEAKVSLSFSSRPLFSLSPGNGSIELEMSVFFILG